MSEADHVYAAGRSCPSCEAAIPARAMVCPRCGGVPEVEAARLAATGFFDRLFGRLSGRRAAGQRRAIPRLVLVWILACVPVLIGPPIIAAVLAAAALRRGDVSSSERGAIYAVFAVCLLNLAVSAWLDVALAGEFVRAAIVFKHAFTDWINDLLTIRVVPGGGHFAPNGGGGSGGRSI